MARHAIVFGEGPEDYRQAEWLAHVLKDEWRFDHTTGRWHHWDGSRWAMDTTLMINMAVAEAVAEGLRRARNDPTKRILTKLLNIHSLERALKALSSMDGYRTDGADWDQRPELLGCSNGLVDLRYNCLVPIPAPTDLVTKTTGREFIACSAPTEFAQRAPIFMTFINQIMSDDETMSDFLLHWFGASMFGFAPEHRFLLMTGVGRNGKGALKHSVLKAIGDYGIQPDANVYMRSRFGGISAESPRAALLELKGRRISFFSEPEGNRFNEEMLKAHTGGDTISARPLFSNAIVSWLPTHSITFLVNNPPDVDDLGPSMASRVMVADFRERYDGEREDTQLYRKLETEADGILAILCWAAADWYAKWISPGAAGLVLPPRVVAQSRDFMQRNDVVGSAIADAMIEDRAASTKSSRLYETYLQWHVRSDRADEPISQIKFSHELTRKGFRGVKRMDGSYWLGLAPKSAMQLAEEEDGDAGEDELA